jgi:hypothetical protein
MLRRVALVRTDVSKKPNRWTGNPDDGSARFLRNVGSYKSDIPEDGILHSHHHENLKSYMDNPSFGCRQKTMQIVEYVDSELYYACVVN